MQKLKLRLRKVKRVSKGKSKGEKRIWDPVHKELTDYGLEVVKEIILRTIREGRCKKVWKIWGIEDWIESMKREELMRKIGKPVTMKDWIRGDKE